MLTGDLTTMLHVRLQLNARLWRAQSFRHLSYGPTRSFTQTQCSSLPVWKGQQGSSPKQKRTTCLSPASNTTDSFRYICPPPVFLTSPNNGLRMFGELGRDRTRLNCFPALSRVPFFAVRERKILPRGCGGKAALAASRTDLDRSHTLSSCVLD